jgi:hypothetical protein
MDTPPKEFQISLSDAIALATEVWRLTRGLDAEGLGMDTTSTRYSIRQLNRVLSNLEIEIVDLTGRPYEAGMAEDVVDIVEDASLPDGHQVVEEMVSPTIAWRRSVVQPGQITVRRSIGLLTAVRN